MKREDMTCATCMFYQVSTKECRRHAPLADHPYIIAPKAEPDYWCGEGEWRERDELLECEIPYSWGQWDTDDFVKNLLHGGEPA